MAETELQVAFLVKGLPVPMAKPFGSDTREASCTQSCAGAGPSFAHLELFCAWRAQSYGVSNLIERRGAAFQKVPNRGWPKLWSQSKPFTRIENHSRFEHPPNTTRSVTCVSTAEEQPSLRNSARPVPGHPLSRYDPHEDSAAALAMTGCEILLLVVILVGRRYL